MSPDVTIERAFLAELDRYIESLKDSLAGGIAKDYAAYAGIVGEIRGLLRAKQEFRDAVSKSQRDDLADEVNNGR